MALRHLKCPRRFTDGKEPRYGSVVESRRCAGGGVGRRHGPCRGEINDSQKASWLRGSAAFDPQTRPPARRALFPDDRPVPARAAGCGGQVRLRAVALRRARPWGAGGLLLQLGAERPRPRFWPPRPPARREGPSGDHVRGVWCADRLMAPGSEWRRHRAGFARRALADLLGQDYALAAKDTPGRAPDRRCEHQEELCRFLRARWQDLCGLTFEGLRYDLTGPYCEGDPPFPQGGPRRHGCRRDHRPDGVPVVLARVVTPEGFPLAGEVPAGHTAAHTPLRAFLQKLETRYGKARRIGVMDRGIPAGEGLTGMRQSDPPVNGVVGTPQGRLTPLEAALPPQPWRPARGRVPVKLLPQADELSVLVQSGARGGKERALRRRKLKKLWPRLRQLPAQRPGYERLRPELGAGGRGLARPTARSPAASPSPSRCARPRSGKCAGAKGAAGCVPI